jgi:hypothetical protein
MNSVLREKRGVEKVFYTLCSLVQKAKGSQARKHSHFDESQ